MSAVEIDAAAHDDPREWVQALILMVEDGWSLGDAARMVSVSYGRAYDALKPETRSQAKNGYKQRKRNPDGVRCSKCGAVLAYASKLEQPLCRPCRTAHGRRNDARIIELWQAGKTRVEIAAELGIENPQDVTVRVQNIRTWQGVALEYRQW